MEIKILSPRTQLFPGRNPNLVALEGVVVSAVLEILADFSAHFKAIRRRNSDIPKVEKAMNIATEQQAVRYTVRSAPTVGLDVGSFQSR
jgi:hypothetical protein